MIRTDRKYFWLYKFIFLCLAFSASVVNCSDGNQSTPGSCLKVESKVENSLVDRNASNVDEQFLADFANCIQEMYNLYESASWTTVPKIISKMKRFIKVITPDFAKQTGKGGVEFELSPLYLFFKIMELYLRSVELEIDCEWYRKEFTYLQTKKIRPLLEKIKRDIFPLLDKLDDASYSKLAESKIKDLVSHNKELKAMSLSYYKDLKDAYKNKSLSMCYGVAAASLCATTLFFRQPYLAVFFCGLGIPAAVSSAYTFYSFSDSGQKLQLLIEDIELLSNQIGDYLILLNDKCPVY